MCARTPLWYRGTSRDTSTPHLIFKTKEKGENIFHTPNHTNLELDTCLAVSLFFSCILASEGRVRKRGYVRVGTKVRNFLGGASGTIRRSQNTHGEVVKEKVRPESRGQQRTVVAGAVEGKL